MWNARRKILVAVLVSCPAVSLAAAETWTKKADMPTPMSCHSASVANGKVYAIGGITNAASAPLTTVEQYDPSTDTWTTKANMPTAKISLCTSAVDGRIYAIGGGQSVMGAGSSTIQEYNPQSDTWTTKADMPTARFVLSASTVNGKIYAIGGKPAHAVAPLSTVEEYDPATDTWARKADMPTARFGLSTCVVNGKIYAIGGDPGWNAGTYRALSTVEVYDPATDTWITKANMPTARLGLSTSVVNGKIYAIGGLSTLGGAALSTVQEYDPATDTWTAKADMPTARFWLSTSTVNGKMYVIGGSVQPWPSWQACPTVEEYDPDPLVVDLNGDFKVDFGDFSLLAQYWYHDQSPFVNHRVDCEDVAGLAEHWLLELGLVAHWKLDETEGLIAHDSAGNHDGTLEGGPTWRPGAGKINGSLELDGIGDYVSTPFVLNPADGPLSVFAWIKGDMPGRVIISQIGSANWLAADPFQGWLITDLKGGGRFGRSLWSQAVITDGHWHRVGLTWDGSNRILYVDDIEVAKDTQSGLASSQGSLYIGAGKNRDLGSLWSGLLDDIRIYNRAVTP